MHSLSRRCFAGGRACHRQNMSPLAWRRRQLNSGCACPAIQCHNRLSGLWPTLNGFKSEQFWPDRPAMPTGALTFLLGALAGSSQSYTNQHSCGGCTVHHGGSNRCSGVEWLRSLAKLFRQLKETPLHLRRVRLRHAVKAARHIWQLFGNHIQTSNCSQPRRHAVASAFVHIEPLTADSHCVPFVMVVIVSGSTGPSSGWPCHAPGFLGINCLDP
jgi:hypothetical protein